MAHREKTNTPPTPGPDDSQSFGPFLFEIIQAKSRQQNGISVEGNRVQWSLMEEL